MKTFRDAVDNAEVNVQRIFVGAKERRCEGGKRSVWEEQYRKDSVMEGAIWYGHKKNVMRWKWNVVENRQRLSMQNTWKSRQFYNGESWNEGAVIFSEVDCSGR